ncbi:MAG: Rieske 2Fe-2S domain-containing protein [Pleurocapsa sp. MO_226.B13]|nr:Rieske 2Fe-2S domain-containing protein [Pleurocapsa sp. MO_226.B13]
MELLKHWHPTVESKFLQKKPILVQLCNEEIVLFRTSQGNIGALKNRCCHRGMRLSDGWVENEEIICPYHAWRYTSSGKVFSPSTPKLNLCVSSFTVIERYGVIWIKSADSSASFPDFNIQDHLSAGVITQEIQAPLEVVVDNFSDIEHNPSTHTYFGYSSENISSVESRIETTDKSVRVINRGVQQSLPWIVEKIFFNVHSGDWFLNDWKTYFSPVYSIFDQFWLDPVTDKPRRIQVKLVVFYIPVSDCQTRLMIFIFANPIVNKSIFQLLVKPIVRFFVDYELKKDKEILENLADKQMSLSEMQLGRYDRVLGENRKRIDCLYRGNIIRPL